MSGDIYVKVINKERVDWKCDIEYKVCYIDVRVLGFQPTKPAEYDENDVTIDEEDIATLEEIEDNSNKEEVVETLFLLGNHETGNFEWFHSSEVQFIR